MVAAVLAGMPVMGAAQAAPTAAPAGIRGEILAQLDDAAGKLAQLAEAIPAERYAWRPAEGVRSVSEVFMHVASANYFFPRFVGGPTEMPLARDAEKTVTDKAEVMRHLTQSFDRARSAIRGVADADLDRTTEMFGRQVTQRAVLLLLAMHAHEHLGQSIAYARSNGVAPPWSMAGN